MQILIKSWIHNLLVMWTKARTKANFLDLTVLICVMGTIAAPSLGGNWKDYVKKIMIMKGEVKSPDERPWHIESIP